ncbi:type II secretion system protein [Helicobacter sp. T3_23-1059]
MQQIQKTRRINRHFNKHFHRHSKSAFSLIELVFVIAVVGILAAIAIPKLSATRTDAQYAAINKDIQAIISSIQVAATTQDNLASSLKGDFIMRIAGLSPLRWIAQGNGVRLSKDGTIDTQNNCVIIDASAQTLNIEIAPLSSSPLCQKLLKAYPNPLRINLQDSLL